MKRRIKERMNGRSGWHVFRLPSSLLRLVVSGLAMIAIASLFGCNKADELAPSTEPFHVNATLSTNEMRIGDLVNLKIEAIHPAGGRMREPRVDQDKKIVVRARANDTQALPDGRLKTVIDYQLTSWSIGDHALLTNTITYLGADGNDIEYAITPLSIHVRSSLSEEDKDLRDIKGLAYWPKKFPRWILVLTGIALLALVIALIVKFLAKAPEGPPGPPPPPPHEIALRELKQLLGMGWIEKEEVEPFYVRLSDIVRHYLENRFDLHAPEQTTEEFIRETASSGALQAEHRGLLGDFLVQADLVKFAKHRPGPSDMRAAYDAGVRFVKDTVPAESEGNPAQ